MELNSAEFIPFSIATINNIMESCRICMALSDNKICIFDTETQNIVDEIQFCTGLQLKKEDRLPSFICNICLTNLSIAYKFKTSCLLADETFKKILVTVKTENFTDVKYENFEYEIDVYNGKVKDELVEKDDVTAITSGVRKSGIRLKKENDCTKSKSKGLKKPRFKKYKFKKLWCESCDIRFSTKEENAKHRREKHKDSQHWVCEICGKLFVHRASHYAHMKSHLPPKYGCDHCAYKTWHKHDLVKHIRIHTGTKVYQCEYCTSSYYTSSNLTTHIRRSHMKLKPYQCTACTKTFFDKSKLDRHVDSHNEVKRFECEVCRSSFSRRYYWRKHMFRKHNITLPSRRPGRQKTNIVIGEDLLALTGAEQKVIAHSDH